MEYLFIVNPTAGKGRALQISKSLAEKASHLRLACRFLETEYAGHATEIARDLARERTERTVISVGGDGTAREVAKGLVDSDVPMGIIPAGTGNDFIKTVRIPGEPEEALEMILKSEPRRIDTGEINNSFFLNECGTGFDVTVLDCTEEYKERFHGLLPYMLGLLKAIFRYRPVQLTIEADGAKETGRYLVCSIANGRYIGGGIPISPRAEVQDGLLNLLLIRDVPRWKIPFYLPGLMLSKDLKFRISSHRTVRAVRLEAEGIRVNIDGDVLPMTQADFRIRPKSLLLHCG